MSKSSFILLNLICGIFIQTLHAQVIHEIELTPDGIVLPRLDKMSKATIPQMQGQVLFNTTNSSLVYSDGLNWEELSTRNDAIEFGQLQLPYVSVQGDRLYLGNGKHVTIPGISAAQPATISDPEGNNYGTFCYTFGIAGVQYCWMTENLRATKYNDGSPIPDGNGIPNTGIPVNAEWMFDYANDSRYTPTYGKLYTHQVIKNTKKICPVGYDVPTRQHWLDLTNWLAGNTPSWAGKEAIALKAQFAGWQSVSGGQEVDYFGFNILPTGFKAATFYSGKTTAAKFWSFTPGTGNNAYRANLSFLSNLIDVNEEHNNNGFSVRCVKVTP